MTAAVEVASGQAAPLTRGQVLKLCLISGVPFVGFGIVDNGIMIVAGDAIDNTLGVALGISTLAAAGLGNLISDVAGIGAGDVIERWCVRMGVKEPPLSALQLASDAVRKARTVGSVGGIALGCLIGMFPLLFIDDRKALYFKDEELLLYETFFQPWGVNTKDFFDLMQCCTWRSAEVGSVVMPPGRVTDRVLLVHTGVASAYRPLEPGEEPPHAAAARKAAEAAAARWWWPFGYGGARVEGAGERVHGGGGGGGCAAPADSAGSAHAVASAAATAAAGAAKDMEDMEVLEVEAEEVEPGDFRFGSKPPKESLGVLLYHYRVRPPAPIARMRLVSGNSH